MEVLKEVEKFISVVDAIEIENKAAIKSKEHLEEMIKKLAKENQDNKEALDIATHAIEILRQVSDEAVGKAYGFLEESLNTALARMFKHTTRQIQIKESTFKNQYPQLEIILFVGNGKQRSIKNNSGHGIAQIISILSVLSLIVITGSRRFLAIDEVVSGLSVHNRKVLTDILWTFTEIGFQFLINDHGFVPRGSQVHYLEMVGDVSSAKERYISKHGVYLQGKAGYTEKEEDDFIDEDETVEIKNNSFNNGEVISI